MTVILRSQADSNEEQLIELQEDINSLSRILAAIIRQLRPDVAVLYADYEATMVADLIAEYGEDGLVEELMGPSPGMWVT